MTDYLVDHEYPPVFHPEQSPIWLDAVLTALGFAPVSGVDWCEIGCGRGFTAAIMAAANPSMRFTGIDINPGHIAAAEALAEASGLENVSFHCADIRADTGFGRFDYIVTHGIMSWVGDDVRAAIAGFAAGHLTPEGVAAIQYMSDPGGAAFRAFHAVFRALSSHSDPVGEGLRLLTAMRDAKAGFFQLHPHASQTLDNLLRETPGYIAHEYMNPNFSPLSFQDVDHLFATHGLGWCGSATPIENIDAVSLPAQAARIIAPIPERRLRETLKDIARNQAQRYDLFRSAQGGQDDVAHLARLRDVTWTILPSAPPPAALVFDTSIGPVDADERIFGPLLTALHKGPASFAALEKVDPFAGRPGLLNQSLQVAMWVGIAHPVVSRPDVRSARRLNRLLLQQAASGADVPALAVPAIGSGIRVSKELVSDLNRGSGDARLRKLLCLN